MKKSALTVNDTLVLIAAAQTMLQTLVRVAKGDERPENWSRIELARGTPSWTRVKRQKETATNIAALRQAIRRARRDVKSV